MKGKRLTALLGAGVIAALLVTPASAEVTVPEEGQINDPFHDANFLNDQGNPGVIVQGNPIVVPDNDDNETDEDFSAVADIGKVWFSMTEETVSAHVQTEAAPPEPDDIHFRVHVNPGEGSTGSNALGCLKFYAIVPGDAPAGSTYQGADWVRIHDACNHGTSAITHSEAAELTIEELEDGSGVITITAPRLYSPILQGETVTITKPYAETTVAVGANVPGAVHTFSNLPKYDTTKIGTDVELSLGGAGSALCAGFEKWKGNHVLGTPEKDELHGTAGRDIICGLGGDDVLYGYNGKDIIVGGAGLDQVHGGDGRDRLQGGDDNDNLTGGDGKDNLNGGAGDDKLNGGFGKDRLNGSTGKDVCTNGGWGTDHRKACERR